MEDIESESKKITSAYGDVEGKEKLEVYSKIICTFRSIGSFASKIKDIVNPIYCQAQLQLELQLES